ncbi:WD40-repeat-containing domain protein [Aspergillus californicus]
MNMHPERIRLQGDFTSVSPDGKFLTCVTRSRGSLRLVRGSRVEDWIFVWDLELNRMRHQIPCEGPVWSVVVSPDSRTILACTKGGIARFWNAESGIFEHSLALSCDRALRGHYSPGVKHIAFICNEEEGKGTVHIYEVETKTVISVWEQPDIAINSVDWAPDRELLAIATSRGVCLWDPISQIEQTAWNVRVYDHDIEKPRFVSVLDVRFVDQGKKLIFNTARGMTEVYDFENNSGHRYGKMRRERKRGRSKLCTSISAPKVFVRDDNVACSKDSTFFVTVDKRELLRIWSLRGATDDRDDIT